MAYNPKSLLDRDWDLTPRKWTMDPEDLKYFDQIARRVSSSSQLDPATSSKTATLSRDALLEMIWSRLRTKNIADRGVSHMYPAHVLEAEKVHVFVIAGGEPVVLTDDFALFPSDAFITSLRLLKK